MLGDWNGLNGGGRLVVVEGNGQGHRISKSVYPGFCLVAWRVYFNRTPLLAPEVWAMVWSDGCGGVHL